MVNNMTIEEKLKIIEFLKSIEATDGYTFNRILTETDFDKASNFHIRLGIGFLFSKEILDYQEPLMAQLIQMQMDFINEINIVRQRLIKAYTK